MACLFLFFNDTATTEIYTLSLHDALPIFRLHRAVMGQGTCDCGEVSSGERRGRDQDSAVDQTLAAISTVQGQEDRKSTRLNSSHANISYAVFCLNKNTLFAPQRRFGPHLP